MNKLIEEDERTEDQDEESTRAKKRMNVPFYSIIQVDCSAFRRDFTFRTAVQVHKSEAFSCFVRLIQVE